LGAWQTSPTVVMVVWPWSGTQETSDLSYDWNSSTTTSFTV